MATARTNNTKQKKPNPAKKAAPKKVPAQKAASKKAAAPKRAPVKPAPAKKPAAKKTATKKAAPKRAASRVTADEILGQITRLMMMSPKHRQMFVSEVELQVVPPLKLGQCRVLMGEDGQPLAYASWARVSDEVHARLEAGNHRLRPDDWNSGPHPWLIDIVAPPKALPQVLAELQTNVFKGEKVRTLLERPKQAEAVGGVN